MTLDKRDIACPDCGMLVHGMIAYRKHLGSLKCLRIQAAKKQKSKSSGQ